jgi:hypothetical protein
MKKPTPREEFFVTTLGGWLLAADGFHWLITPMNHPEAGTFRYAAVWAQILVGLACTVWARRRIRRASS